MKGGGKSGHHAGTGTAAQHHKHNKSETINKQQQVSYQHHTMHV